MAISFEQQGELCQSVRIAVMTELCTYNLRFYTYNRETNTFRLMAEPNSLVENGFVYFCTAVGGDIIISDGALRRK